MKGTVVGTEKFEREPGIYGIFNEHKKSVYIGQTSDLKRRIEEHVRFLYNNSHSNLELQKEFKKKVISIV